MSSTKVKPTCQDNLGNSSYNPSLNTLLLVAASVIFALFSLMGPLTALTNFFFSTDVELVEFHNETNHLYVVFFDGGSTGTRSHIFTFLNHSGGHLDLISEEYDHVQPGLSSYAVSPEKAANSLVPLLEKAKNSIPKYKWSTTPVVLKATAGLRLLPEKTANDILNEVQNIFALSPFKYTPNSVSILGGTDEGMFAWETVNLLLGKLNDMEETVAALDLGGGSTQITFLPDELHTLMVSPPQHILAAEIAHKVNKPVTLYTKSYLGFGLMSARLAVLRLSNKHPMHVSESKIVLNTPCFYPDSEREWTYNDTVYSVRGTTTMEFGYHPCKKQVKLYLSDTIFQPPEIQQKSIYALSYYYDRAVDAGIIARTTQAKILIEDFKIAAKKICSSPNKELFLCLDLTYITALLHDGLGLSYDKEIYLSKKIQNVEASWVLGAAFQYLS